MDVGIGNDVRILDLFDKVPYARLSLNQIVV